MEANFAWLFQYMPIGRAITLDLLPTPEQRLWMWKRSWELIRDRWLYISDFWNGDVLPCAFMPYSPANINKVYADGKTLNDIWNEPFFHKVREWQIDYGYDKGREKSGNIRNWMMPCPMRDHYKEFHPVLQKFQLNPIDENAGAALNDPDYRKGMIEYNRAVADLLDPIWQNEYLDPDYKISTKKPE